MPNPLTRLMGNQSREEDTPKRGLTPVEDNPAGDNVPYRGVVDHGVPWDESDARDVPGYGERDAVVYEQAPVEQNPIPVYIVNEGGREVRRMRTVRGVAGGSTNGRVRDILGFDEDRVSARIRNPGADIVYITENLSDWNGAVLNGYPLIQNESYETRSQEPVYAAVANANDASVNVIIEYAVAV